ncbi:baseplate assembly protein [Variovorax ureilyticus]|uniref:baseplate assembly protein n=1 Tax=Variovorax ureilyticus TaxID=1836198 RepID=UPI003D67E457
MSLDMTLLPAPQVIEVLDFETILQAKKTKFQALCAEAGVDYTLMLESDPVTKLLELCAYDEMLMRQRINDAAKASMLAYAKGTDLDNLAANLGVVRLLVTPADPAAVPPVDAVYESDDRLRERAQLALEGLTTAGSRASYRFHALTASGQVADVGVESLVPGAVLVSILAVDPSGVPDAALLDTVRNALSAEKVRPLTDLVNVRAVEIIESPITATLYRKSGPAGEVAAEAASAALNKWLLSIRRQGEGLARSGIDAALHQPGMHRVVIDSPAEDIVSAWNQWVRVTGINLTEVVVQDDD